MNFHEKSTTIWCINLLTNKKEKFEAHENIASKRIIDSKSKKNTYNMLFKNDKYNELLTLLKKERS